jgi:hypothetical protein
VLAGRSPVSHYIAEVEARQVVYCAGTGAADGNIEALEPLVQAAEDEANAAATSAAASDANTHPKRTCSTTVSQTFKLPTRRVYSRPLSGSRFALQK